MSRRAWSEHPMSQLVAARLREFFRQPEAVFWVYVFPTLMMVSLGVAFRSRPVEQLHVLIIESPLAESIRQTLDQNDRFRAEIDDETKSRERLRTGKVDLVISATAEETAAEPSYSYSYDPTRPGSHWARDAVHNELQSAAGRQDVFDASSHELVEPGGRYIDFLVPGLLGLGLMGGGLWGVGFAIVDLRIRKLLKRYLATPMKRSHFLAAMMISRLVFTISEAVVLLICARLLFGVVNYGSYLTVGLLIVLGAFQFAGIGLLVASRAQTLEAVSGLMNLVMLPMWIASGVFYSVDRFPETIQPILRVLPLTPLIDAVRAVMLEGATLTSLGIEILLCLLWGTLTFLLALKWFRWS